jgi:hypothetical protein
MENLPKKTRKYFERVLQILKMNHLESDPYQVVYLLISLRSLFCTALQ